MKLDNEPRLSAGPSLYQSLIEWARKVVQTVNERATLDSPALTGTPTAPTPPTSDNSTRIATTNWVRAAMANIASAAGFAASFGTNSFVKFPSWLGDFVVQFGYATPGGAGFATVTFPLTFPTACHVALANAFNTAPAANVNISVIITGTTTANFTCTRRYANGGVTGDAGDAFVWIAFGR